MGVTEDSTEVIKIKDLIGDRPISDQVMRDLIEIQARDNRLWFTADVGEVRAALRVIHLAMEANLADRL